MTDDKKGGIGWSPDYRSDKLRKAREVIDEGRQARLAGVALTIRTESADGFAEARAAKPGGVHCACENCARLEKRLAELEGLGRRLAEALRFANFDFAPGEGHTDEAADALADARKAGLIP